MSKNDVGVDAPLEDHTIRENDAFFHRLCCNVKNWPHVATGCATDCMQSVECHILHGFTICHCMCWAECNELHCI